MRAIICIANVAGRVGKSMTAAFVASELALLGYNTLLVDSDPQAGATQYFLDPEQARLSVSDLLLKRKQTGYSWSGSPPQHEYLLTGVVQRTEIDRLELIPSDIRLARFEREPPFCTAALRSELASARDFYDYAIIDTPPYIGQILMACLIASTHVLIPVAPAPRVPEGPECLMTLVENVRGVNPRLDLLGVACNLLERHHAPSRELASSMGQWFKEKAMKSLIFRDDEIGACRLHHRPIQAFASDSAELRLAAMASRSWSILRKSASRASGVERELNPSGTGGSTSPSSSSSSCTRSNQPR